MRFGDRASAYSDRMASGSPWSWAIGAIEENV